MMRTAALLLALPLLAGCLASQDPGPDYGALESTLKAAALPALEFVHGNGTHLDARLHRGAWNLRLVGYSNGVDGGGPASLPAQAYYTELAVGTDGYAYLAAASADGSFGGLRIVDVTEPSRPVAAGSYDAQGAVDVEVDPDSRYAYLATQRNTPEQVAQGLQSTQDPRASAPRGITILDVQDKRRPAFVSFVPLPANGPHTLTYVRHPNGEDYLLACTYDLVTDPATNAIAATVPVTQRLLVYLVQKGGGVPAPLPGSPLPPPVGLVPVAQYQRIVPAAPGPDQPFAFPHEARAYADPLDPGRTLLALAYWDEGVRILDFTHPPAPPAPPALPEAEQAPVLPEVGSFVNFAPSAYNSIHQAQAFPGRLANRQVLVAAPELIDAADETGQVSFLDATDPAHPSMLGHWSLRSLAPDLAVTDLDFSPHNFDLWDGKVALAHYHAGVWVLDVHDEANLREPKAVAFYMPAMPRPDSPVPQPNVWGIVQSGGLLYVSDMATGLSILRYTGP